LNSIRTGSADDKLVSHKEQQRGWGLPIVAANSTIAFQVQSTPNNADFDNAPLPFAG